MKYYLLLFCCCLVPLSATIASAETRYVIDMLIVTVRDNNSDNYQILETLPTAAPVEVLAEDKNFVKVRTEKGTVGYISKQYITSETPKKIVIARLEKQVSQLQGQLDTQKQDCREQTELASSSQMKIESTNQELTTVRRQLDQVSKEYASLQEQSKNVVALATERDHLASENTRLASELSVLQAENSSFHRSNIIQWFLAGGGVFFGGWLVGKISRKKKRGFGNF